MDPQREVDTQDNSQPPFKRSRSNSPTSSTEADEATKKQTMVEKRFENLINEVATSIKESKITLEGDSLSERQRKLNATVNNAHEMGISLTETLLLDTKTDLDNIYKIDLASKYRNVDYIIENVKSTDSLRVNRALKAHWLFNDIQYSYIINPTYIDTTLQPLMSDKAYNKFMSQIAYYLKDEKRCKDFYLYYLKKKDGHYMRKFLLNCSVDFIKETIAREDFYIYPKYLSVLSRRSFEIVIAYVDKQSRYKIDQQHLKGLRYLMDDHGEFYLDLLEDNVENNYVHFRLGQRVTREIIRNYRNRIFQRPLLYLNLLHYKQLIHAMNHDDIKELATQVTNSHDFWANSWLKNLLNLLPDENRYKFIKSLYERYHPGEDFEMKIEFSIHRWHEYMNMKQKEEWALEHIVQRNEYFGKLYQWYKFVCFDISFRELKKLLRAETDASERQTMFEILISTCDEDEHNIIKLLKYLQERHINETILFKQHIIGKIMNEKNICKCSDEVWKVLINILLSMRIYEDVNDCNYNFKKSAIAQVMVHYIIYDKTITEKLFRLYEECYSTLNIAITTPWKAKVFEFVQNWIFTTKVDQENLEDSIGLSCVVHWTIELINLHKRFGYPPMEKLIKIMKKLRECDSNHFSDIVFYDEAYKEYFQDEIQPPKCASKLTEVICLRKLKTDITLLSSCKGQFTENIQINKMRYKRFLSKIRIYFEKDLGPDWRKYLFENFKENHKDPRGCACVIFGLTILLPAAECKKIIKEYQPENAKLAWSETDPCLVHIQTNIAKFMHLVRPAINHEYLTPYAKGDFLQHALQSLLSLSRQLPKEKIRELILKLLASPVSIQKHGIRLAFKKFSLNELVNISRKLWIKTQNISIQKLIFNYAHNLLTNAEDDEKRFDIWKLFNMLLEQLHGNEYLTNIVDPHNQYLWQVGISVRPQYCTAYWNLLQSVSISEQIWSYRETILNEMRDESMINLLDETFLKEIIFNFLDTFFNKNEDYSKKIPESYISSIWNLIATFIVRCEAKNIAESRKDVFMKVLEYFFSRWNNTDGHFYRFLVLIISNSQTILRENEFYNPLHLFEYVYYEISIRWPQREYYDHRLWLKFTVTLIKSLQESGDFKPKSDKDQCKLWAEIFGKYCVELMRSETAENYPRLPQIFRHHFLKFISNESHRPHGYDKVTFYIGVSKSLLKERENLDCCILAAECLVKIHREPDKFEAESMLSSIRAMDVPELNHFIDTLYISHRHLFK